MPVNLFEIVNKTRHIRLLNAPIIQASCSFQVAKKYSSADIENIKKACQVAGLNEIRTKEVFFIVLNQTPTSTKEIAYEFKNPKGDKHVDITTNTLTISTLGDYQSWDIFEDFVFSIFSSLINKKDLMLNLILKKTNSFLFNDYLTLINSFNYKVVFENNFFDHNGASLTLTKKMKDDISLSLNATIQSASNKFNLVNNIQIVKDLENRQCSFSNISHLKNSLFEMNEHLFQSFVNFLQPDFFQTFNPTTNVANNP